MAPRVRALDLGAKDHKRLQELAAVGDLPARVLLCRAAGVSQAGTASCLGLNRLTVANYERVFRTVGVIGLANIRPGRPRTQLTYAQARKLLQRQVAKMSAHDLAPATIRRRAERMLSKLVLKVSRVDNAKDAWRSPAKSSAPRGYICADEIREYPGTRCEIWCDEAEDLRDPSRGRYHPVYDLPRKKALPLVVRRQIRDIKRTPIPVGTHRLSLKYDQRPNTATISVDGLIDRTVDALSLVLVAHRGKDNRILWLECTDQQVRLECPTGIYWASHVYPENYRPGDVLVFNDNVTGISVGTQTRVKEVDLVKCRLVLEDGREFDPLVAVKEWTKESPLRSRLGPPWSIYARIGMAERTQAGWTVQRSSAHLRVEDRHRTLDLLVKEAFADIPELLPTIRDGISGERFSYRNHGTDKQYWRTLSGRLSIRAAALTESLDSAFAMPQGLSPAERRRYRASYWRVIRCISVYTKSEDWEKFLGISRLLSRTISVLRKYCDTDIGDHTNKGRIPPGKLEALLKDLARGKLRASDEQHAKIKEQVRQWDKERNEYDVNFPSKAWIDIEVDWYPEWKRCALPLDPYLLQNWPAEQKSGLFWNVHRALMNRANQYLPRSNSRLLLVGIDKVFVRWPYNQS